MSSSSQDSNTLATTDGSTTVTSAYNYQDTSTYGGNKGVVYQPDSSTLTTTQDANPPSNSVMYIVGAGVLVATLFIINKR